ncbi:hypothetical protein ASL67_22030 [Salmonella enterica]|nr:hypothetical protein [Salmonella enterica]
MFILFPLVVAVKSLYEHFGKERSEAPETEILRCYAGWFSRSWCRTEQGNLRVAEIPLFYSKWQNGWFKVKIAKKSIIYDDAFGFLFIIKTDGYR